MGTSLKQLIITLYCQDIEEELVNKEETVRSIRKTGQRLQTKPILSKPSQEDVKRRMDAVESHWQRIKLGVPRRRKNLDDKLEQLAKFLENLEELRVYTSTTRDILDTQAGLGKSPDQLEDIEVGRILLLNAAHNRTNNRQTC